MKTILLLALALSIVSPAEASADKEFPPMLAAARDGRVDELERLIQGGAAVTAADSNGLTSLHWAALKGHVDVVAALLEHHADVDSQGNDYAWTPLMVASAAGEMDVARILLDHGANINALSGTHKAPLYHAALGAHADLARLLLARGANGTEVFASAVRDGNAKVVNTLLDAGVDVNGLDKFGTALYWAAEHNDPAMVDLLLARGADPNVALDSSDNMRTPLMWAAYHCNADVVAKLLAHHAALDTKNANGRTAGGLANRGWTSDMKPCSAELQAKLQP